MSNDPCNRAGKSHGELRYWLQQRRFGETRQPPKPRSAEPDLNNFGPRFGLAYQLSPKTVIRTGYGIFYTLEDAGHHNPLFNPPFSASFSFPSNQLTPDSALRPSSGFPPWPCRRTSADFSSTSTDARTISRPPTASSGILRSTASLGPIHLETAYVGNKANKLMANRNINQPLPGPGSSMPAPLSGMGIDHLPGTSRQLDLSQLAGERRETLLGREYLPRVLHVCQSDRRLRFHPALDHLRHGQSSGSGQFRAERSRSFQDVKHRLVASYLYELPFGKGRRYINGGPRALDLVAGGWQINGITSTKAGERLRSRRHSINPIQDVEYPPRRDWYFTESAVRPAKRAAVH